MVLNGLLRLRRSTIFCFLRLAVLPDSGMATPMRDLGLATSTRDSGLETSARDQSGIHVCYARFIWRGDQNSWRSGAGSWRRDVKIKK